MKLELKHLAPYLPYGLKVKTEDGIFKVVGWVDGVGICLDTIFYGANAIPTYKLILRPLSSLTDRINPIQHHTYLDGLNYPNIDSVENALIKGHLFVEDYQYLIEHHFDVSGLIKHGLAIDINTLK